VSHNLFSITVDNSYLDVFFIPFTNILFLRLNEGFGSCRTGFSELLDYHNFPRFMIIARMATSAGFTPGMRDA